jgi:dethiobiotin synthase
MSKQFFITGTDTGVGKTHVSAILTHGLKASYWKPIQSGIEEESDTELVARLTQLPENHFIPEVYRLKKPRSPHEAAESEGKVIDPEQLRLPAISGNLIVEGAGGLHVPITWDYWMIDLIKSFDLPVIVVTRTQLGTLNHTLLSLEALKARNISVAGYIMTGNYDYENERSLKRLTQVPFLGFVPYLSNWSSDELDKVFKNLTLP